MAQDFDAIAPRALGVPDALGLLLTVRAAERLHDVVEVRLTSLVTRSGAGLDHRDRQVVAAALTGGANALVDGTVVDERLAEHRWLAWFPRPVGPHHAVNVPSATVAVLPEVLPTLALARAHLALRSWQAELLQAGVNLVRTQVGLRVLDRWVRRGRDPDEGAVGAADDRWACLVEAVDDRSRLVRAWAHGTGRHAATAHLEAALDPVATGSGGGWCTPVAAREVLDDLAGAGDLRWSLTEPTATDPTAR